MFPCIKGKRTSHTDTEENVSSILGRESFFMLVKEIMSGKVVSISPDENTALAARLLSRYNIGALPVCTKEGKLRGMVTDRDIVLRCVAAGEEPEATKISHIMTRKVVHIDAEDTVEKAVSLMGKEQIRRLPVEDKGKIVGMISLGDIAKARSCTAETGEALSEISENIRTI